MFFFKFKTVSKMKINELPDDCLMTIFDYLKDFKDLSSCLKVCQKWNSLIAYRFAKIKRMATSTYDINPDIIEYINPINELFLVSSTLQHFSEVARYFTNLERLHIGDFHENQNVSAIWPVMENLKILEMSLSSSEDDDMCYSLSFIDSCPALESVLIHVNTDSILIDDTKKNLKLRDLALLIWAPLKWNDLCRLLSKYPNVKHLALRHYNLLQDKHIKQLLFIFPQLIVLDVRRCSYFGLTHQAANYVREYCEEHGRSVEFYSRVNQDEFQADWPELSKRYEKGSQGFDFMFHCFYRIFFFGSVFFESI